MTETGHDVCVRCQPWFGAFVVAAALVAAGCGGSAKNQTLTVKVVASATRNAKTARMTLKTKSGVRPPTLTGDADFAHDRFRIHYVFSKGPGSFLPPGWSPTLDEIIIPGHKYWRGLMIGQSQWCDEVSTSSTRQPFGVDPSGALSSLRPPETLQRVGVETVGGVATTRYRVLNGPKPTEDTPSPAELWVDRQDQVRRVTEAFDNGDGTTYQVIVEFYDFGASLTPITAPPSAQNCSS